MVSTDCIQQNKSGKDPALLFSCSIMRIRTAPPENGTILLIILVTMVIIGVTLGSYLLLVANQNLSVMRSEAWNSAIAVAEAGIEEAMAHLNTNPTNRAVDGWEIEGQNVVKERKLGTSKYRVSISKDLEPPVITAEGFVQIPKTQEFISPPRTVRVTTTNDALFAKGMTAKGRIDLSGNKIRVDSFDSSDPAFSTDGLYDPTKNKDGGDVATNSSVEDSLNIWNADILGRASTGPGGDVRLGSNGTVGSKAWHGSGQKGAEPGWTSDDMNVHFPDVKRPWNGTTFPPKPLSFGGTNYIYGLETGDYQLTELKLSGSEKVLITGHARLLITKELMISGNAAIYIASGASLQLFMEGEKANIQGTGIVNGTGNAAAFSYWGLNSNKDLTLGGNAAFVGTVYAPHAQLTLGGGGNNSYDFVGASVSNSVRLNGHFNFHYDEALKRWGPRRGYTITSWNEIGGDKES
jgi:hypothetical protein